jgi:arginine-tRNA-protein transferase
MNFPPYIFADEAGFRSEMLDEMLAKGYYRTQHLMFTLNSSTIESFSKEKVPLFWLRTNLKNLNETKNAKNIRNRNRIFTVSYRRARITREINDLYKRYKTKINFSVSESVSQYLHQTELPHPFNSWMVELRDQEKLIAVGYFDKGKNSMAGILNIFDPEYHKFSLGKYLILKKIDFAISENMEFYYTGYIGLTIEKFDYKLFPDSEAIEVFLPAHNAWVGYNTLGKSLLKEYFHSFLEK